MSESAAESNDRVTRNERGFSADFADLVPLIRDEWPDVAADALDATAGDYGEVVALIAGETDHTKTLIRKQLEELQQLLGKNGAASRAARAWKDFGNTWGETDELKRIRELLERLQHKSNDVASYVREQMVDEAEKQVKRNPIVSLLMAIGLGFIVGFILRGGGGRR